MSDWVDPLFNFILKKPMILSDLVAKLGVEHGVLTEPVIVVCQSAEKRQIATLLRQLSWGARVAGIITEDDLVTWYNKAFTGSFSEDIGDELVVHVREGIESEFQYVGQKLNDFFTERGYDGISNHGDWSVGNIKGDSQNYQLVLSELSALTCFKL